MVFTIERILDEETKATRRSTFEIISEVEAIDEYEVRVVTDPVNADVPALLADRSAVMLSPSSLEDLGDDFTRQPVGTGPYQFDLWNADRKSVV